MTTANPTTPMIIANPDTDRLSPSQSSPRSNGLVSWWKQFKQRADQRENSTTSAGSSSLLQRPKVPHMSHSSGAIPKSTMSSHSASGAGYSVGSNSGPSPESVVFDVALTRSIQYAKLSITLSDEDGERFIYGQIPVVVGKCGNYLKANATHTEWIFRKSGSEKRKNELVDIFNTPPRFGKGLDWTGFTVHDAAAVLRRYLSKLPEPVIPLMFYDDFRKPLIERQDIIDYLKHKEELENERIKVMMGTSASAAVTEQATTAADVPGTSQGSPLAAPASTGTGVDSPLSSSPNSPAFHPLTSAGSTANPRAIAITTSSTTPVLYVSEPDSSQDYPRDGVTSDEEDEASLDPQLRKSIDSTIEIYEDLISKLPTLNRQLLLYILDMLHLFDINSDYNHMPSANLAKIFAPSLLSHPDHDMSPDDYVTNCAVIHLLIKHSSTFLTKMEADAKAEHARRKMQNGGSAPSDQQLSVTQKPSSRPHSRSMSSVNPSSTQLYPFAPQQQQQSLQSPHHHHHLTSHLLQHFSHSQSPNQRTSLSPPRAPAMTVNRNRNRLPSASSVNSNNSMLSSGSDTSAPDALSTTSAGDYHSVNTHLSEPNANPTPLERTTRRLSALFHKRSNEHIMIPASVEPSIDATLASASTMSPTSPRLFPPGLHHSNDSSSSIGTRSFPKIDDPVDEERAGRRSRNSSDLGERTSKSPRWRQALKSGLRSASPSKSENS